MVSTPQIVSLISQLVHSIYQNQPVQVKVLEERQLWVEAYGGTQLIPFSAIDSFESIFEHLIQWIELRQSYSWSQSPQVFRLLEAISARYRGEVVRPN